MIRDANFWNNKWPRAPILYGGRVLRIGKEAIGCDVKNFITPKDELIKRVVEYYHLRKPTANETALACQKFVVSFLTYKYDDDLNLTPEFWQFPFETLQSEHGDCEDGAILTATLCVHAGIPAHRVKVAAGYVKDSPTAPEGGHAYCIYLADRGKDNQEWVILDWCYFSDENLPIERKPLAKDGGYNKCYKDVWFTFNNELSWNQQSLVLEARISENQSLIKEAVVSRNQDMVDRIISKIDTKINKE